MVSYSVLLSLGTNENDYQRAQAEAAKAVAQSIDLKLEIQYAENDAVLQSQQVLKALQHKTRRFDAIIVQPVGTSMEQPARLASASGIVWGILNHDADYVSTLRQCGKATQFEVTSDQLEVGRIQARQAAALLPHGGVALYMEGPSTGTAARLRAEGMMAAKPENLQLKILKGDWTAACARKSIVNWIGLSTSRKLGISIVICQNDNMAAGAHDALQSSLSGTEREQWLRLPITGCDGLPGGGQEMVKRGTLTATIIIPPNAGIALELAGKALRGEPIPERTVCTVQSYPSIEKLRQQIGAIEFASR
jgi:ABC-type sugar transport system substrate-binding protein